VNQTIIALDSEVNASRSHELCVLAAVSQASGLPRSSKAGLMAHRAWELPSPSSPSCDSHRQCWPWSTAYPLLESDFSMIHRHDTANTAWAAPMPWANYALNMATKDQDPAMSFAEDMQVLWANYAPNPKPKTLHRPWPPRTKTPRCLLRRTCRCSGPIMPQTLNPKPYIEAPVSQTLVTRYVLFQFANLFISSGFPA